MSERNPYTKGRRVYWTDPDNGACSAPGVIVEGISDENWKIIQDWEHGDGDEDADIGDFVIRVINDAGGEIECNAMELLLSCTSNGIHDGLTFGFGEPDDHGYFYIPDYIGARAAEKRDGVPVDTYWPLS